MPTDWFDGRLEVFEENVSETEDKTKENIQNKTQKIKR
jgi:hypothetical protein